MASFTGEADRKSRFLRELYYNGGMPHLSAVFAEITMSGDHKRWMTEDAIYRRAFSYATTEGVRRLKQHLFNLICHAARNNDQTSSDWIRDNCGEETLESVQRGDNPTWNQD
jgi:hypothetical protein